MQKQQADRNLLPSKILLSDIKDLSKFDQWKISNERRMSRENNVMMGSEVYNNKMGIGRKSIKSLNSLDSANAFKNSHQIRPKWTDSEENHNMSKSGSGSGSGGGISREEVQQIMQN